MDLIPWLLNAISKPLRNGPFFATCGGPYGPGFSVGFNVLGKVLASVVAFLAGSSVSCSVLGRVLASVLGPLSQKLQNGPDPVAAKCHLKTSTKRLIFRNLRGGPHGQGFSVGFSVLGKVLASVVAFLAGSSVSCSVLGRVLASVLGPLSQKLQNGPDPVADKCHLKTSTKRAIFRNYTDQVLASVLAFLTRF